MQSPCFENHHRLLGVRALLVFASCVLFAGFGAAQTLTREQLDLLQTVPESEREALLEQLLQGGETETSPLEERRVPPLPANAFEPELGGREIRRLQPGDQLVLQAGDTIVLDIRERFDRDRTEADRERLLRQTEVWLAANPFVLDASGLIDVPGLAGIALAGLTPAEAAKRLTADPAFAEHDVSVTLLPVEPTGTAALRPFGVDFFRALQVADWLVGDAPVPPSYVLGPGDQLDVQLFGSERARYTLPVTREGQIDFPRIGPIPVAGLTLENVRAAVERAVSDQMIGAQASVTLGELRGIRVFVLGEVRNPGPYTVSSLASITTALYAAGGVSEIGSLRHISLKRNGADIGTFDVYDLLLSGDTSGDRRLEPGDAIFVPPVRKSAAISGEVRRPAIYEVSENATLSELIELAGRLLPTADSRLARLERIDESRDRIVIDVDLRAAQAANMRLNSGDVLHVPPVRPTMERAVVLKGNVYRPIISEFRPGMRLTHLLPSVAELKPKADIQYVVIRRESPVNGTVTVLSADLLAALNDPNGRADPQLAAKDQVIVLSTDVGRERDLRPIMEDLERQATQSAPLQAVTVSGRVKSPGTYPLEPAMRVSGALRAAGGLQDQAYLAVADLARYEVVGGERRQVTVVSVDIASVLRGDPAADVVLQPYDHLSVKGVSEWQGSETITLSGEVRFPGTYVIENGETLRGVLERAGGLTENAYPLGSVFTRTDLKKREQEQIDALAERLQSELTLLGTAIAQTNDVSAQRQLDTGSFLLGDLLRAEAVGRLVIDLPGAIAGEGDIELEHGDRLAVPRRPNSVTVIGEVQNATSHLWREGIGRDEYIALSGDFGGNADEKRVYVVQADGSVRPEQGRWFSADSEIMPGDTIVVPMDVRRIRGLSGWQSVTQILYNVAISAAALASF
jgi:protein involved in polysaccharide export with SLBB domain